MKHKAYVLSKVPDAFVAAQRDMEAGKVRYMVHVRNYYATEQEAWTQLTAVTEPSLMWQTSAAQAWRQAAQWVMLVDMRREQAIRLRGETIVVSTLRFMR